MKKSIAVTLVLVIALGLSVQALPPVQAAPGKAFDASSLPVSNVPLGAFPYIALPNGYVTATTPDVADFDQVPFWTGDHLEVVEGKVWSAHIDASQEKTFSDLELERNIESLVSSLGGRKILTAGFRKKPGRKSKNGHAISRSNITVVWAMSGTTPRRCLLSAGPIATSGSTCAATRLAADFSSQKPSRWKSPPAYCR